MGNDAQAISRYDKSPASCRHLVSCFLNTLNVSEALEALNDPSIGDVITGYMMHFDTFRYKTDPLLQFGQNGMRVTNTSVNSQKTVNVLGRHIIDVGNSRNHGKTFEWTFEIEQCHFIAFGIIDIGSGIDSMSTGPLYENAETASYFCSNEGQQWSHGQKVKEQMSFIRQSQVKRISVIFEVEVAEYDSILTVQDQRNASFKYGRFTVDRGNMFSIGFCLRSTVDVQSSVVMTDFMVMEHSLIR